MLDFLQAFVAGLWHLLTVKSLAALTGGSLLGYVFGMIPGLQSVTAMVMILPFSFYMDPMTGMYIFAGIIGAAGQGGSVTAIMINMPGTVQNAATAIDGYQLTRQGKACWAVAVASSATMLGSLFGLLVLVILVPVFIPFLMLFGPAEQFWIVAAGLLVLCAAFPGSLLKNLIAVGLGLVLAVIGYGGPNLNFARFTFGSIYLTPGLSLVPVVIGLLVASEALLQVVERPPAQEASLDMEGGRLPFDWAQVADGLKEPFRHLGLVIRSSAIGTWIGALPGTGGVVAQFMAYNAAWATSRQKEKFGHGCSEGVIAAEASVGAKEGGTLLPTLTFGIPGNTETALVLTAWQIHGITPGIFFLQKHADLAWALILGLVLSNIMASSAQLLLQPVMSRVPDLPKQQLGLTVLVFCVLAAFSVQQNLWDSVLVVLLGFLGLVLRAVGFSVVGLLIGFILGQILESNFYTALQSSLGEYAVFLGSPVSLALAGLTILALFVGIWQRRPRRPGVR